MNIYIKFMVSNRCKMLVSETLKRLELQPAYVFLGMVELPHGISPFKQKELKRILLESGLELMDDKNEMLLNKAKKAIHKMVNFFEDVPDMNYSNYLSNELGCDYAHLSKEFSNVKGITLQQYIIDAKIKKAKELLVYARLSLTDISHKMRYSSVAHLSNQFKKTTGHSPTLFKKNGSHTFEKQTQYGNSAKL
jgi:AraC-like DNA-binding protein